MRYLFALFLFSIFVFYITKNFAVAQFDSSPTNSPQITIPDYAPQGSGQSTANSGTSATPMMPAPTLSPKATLCKSVAEQIQAVSKLTSSAQIYPWEDVNWLEKNLGQPQRQTVTGSVTTSMWYCIYEPLFNSFSLTISMALDSVQKESTANAKYCYIGSKCTTFGFTRNSDNTIKGFMQKTNEAMLSPPPAPGYVRKSDNSISGFTHK